MTQTHSGTNCGAQGHVHGPECGHQAVQHEGHSDYIVDGRLHCPHGDHCHDRGLAPPETYVES